jgi:hypothetical protein
MNDTLARVLGGTLLFAVALNLSGCEAIEFVFKAGVWTAVIGIGVLLALAYGVARLLRRGG